MNYQRKPLLVDAYRWDGKPLAAEHAESIPAWLTRLINSGRVWTRSWASGDGTVLICQPRTGRYEVRPGDWIVMENGDIEVLASTAFHDTFEVLNRVVDHHLVVNGLAVMAEGSDKERGIT